MKVCLASSKCQKACIEPVFNLLVLLQLGFLQNHSGKELLLNTSNLVHFNKNHQGLQVQMRYFEACFLKNVRDFKISEGKINIMCCGRCHGNSTFCFYSITV